jgi:hypothetical protein
MPTGQGGGYRKIPQIPRNAIVTNQNAMIGPNALPIRAVPWGCR